MSSVQAVSPTNDFPLNSLYESVNWLVNNAMLGLRQTHTHQRSTPRATFQVTHKTHMKSQFHVYTIHYQMGVELQITRFMSLYITRFYTI